MIYPNNTPTSPFKVTDGVVKAYHCKRIGFSFYAIHHDKQHAQYYGFHLPTQKWRWASEMELETYRNLQTGMPMQKKLFDSPLSIEYHIPLFIEH